MPTDLSRNTCPVCREEWYLHPCRNEPPEPTTLRQKALDALSAVILVVLIGAALGAAVWAFRAISGL
jgi:hypothetical protein